MSFSYLSVLPLNSNETPYNFFKSILVWFKETKSNSEYSDIFNKYINEIIFWGPIQFENKEQIELKFMKIDTFLIKHFNDYKYLDRDINELKNFLKEIYKTDKLEQKL
mgnify:CR=1 FL=1|tara:strand:- start:650 stop:973 length:324 start_codon:yes stop_codon:yes gene_type:complete